MNNLSHQGSAVAEQGSEDQSSEPEGPFPPAESTVRRWGLLDALIRPGAHHTPGQSRRFSVLVAFTVAIAYWFTQQLLPRWTSSNPDLNLYVVQPVIWLGVAAFAGYGWVRLVDRPRFSRVLFVVAFLVGLFHVAVLVIAGVLGDFGDSLSAGRLLNYPKNFLYISTVLMGMESARAYLFQVWKGVSRDAAFGVVAVGFAALALSTSQWTPFSSIDETFSVVGGRWIPALGISVLATALVSLGGIGPSWAYRCALLGFEWFSPILPDLDWPVVAMLGAAIPLASWRLIVNMYADTQEGALVPSDHIEQREVIQRGTSRAWSAVAVLLVVVTVVVSSGLFGVRMVVIEGISMEPAYSRGDVAFIVDNPDPSSLEVNDVITFEQASLAIVHRIVAIEDTPSGLVFTTQGDNNRLPDASVSADLIESKVVFLIPDVGLPVIWVRGG